MSLFSECLNEIRENHQLKIVDLARICKLDTSVVYRWCYGERTPSSYATIDFLAQRLLLSLQEKKKLEHAYMQTIFGEERYQHYLSIDELLNFLHSECNSSQFQLKIMKRNAKLYGHVASSTVPHFHILGSHHSIIRETYKLLHDSNPNITLYIKIHEPFDEFLYMLLHHILIFGPQKMEILLCISENNDFYKSEKLSYLKTISEIFLYNTDAKIMIYSEAYTEMHDTINWIISGNNCLQYDRTMLRGTITNYPEWIENIMFHFNHLKSTAKLLGNKNNKETQSNVSLSHMKEIYIYGFFPQLIYRAEHYNLICGEEDLRNFMKTGKLPGIMNSSEEGFSINDRKNVLNHILHFIANRQASCYLLKKGSLSFSIHFQLYENKQLETSRISILTEKGQNHEINFFDQEILQSFKSYFDVIMHPKYCYSMEESAEKIRKILVEYSK